MLPTTDVRTIKLPSGEAVPALGQGTWHMGEERRRHKTELEALRLGLDLGMTLIDTAEIYSDGESERLVGEAIAGRREQVFLVTKVWPNHATMRGTLAACEGSLKRLATDYIDLYLLHWPSKHPLKETLAGFQELVRTNKIRYWGVSNFDVAQMKDLTALPGGSDVATNQVLYNLQQRGIEADLLPWLRKRKIPIMAYSPIEQGRLLRHRALREIAARHKATPAQIALAWALHQEGAIVIPKAGTAEHVRENRAALDIHLTKQDLDELDRAFPPKHPRSLEML